MVSPINLFDTLLVDDSSMYDLPLSDVANKHTLQYYYIDIRQNDTQNHLFMQLPNCSNNP